MPNPAALLTYRLTPIQSTSRPALVVTLALLLGALPIAVGCDAVPLPSAEGLPRSRHVPPDGPADDGQLRPGDGVVTPPAEAPTTPDDEEAPVSYDFHPEASPWEFAAFGSWDQTVIRWRVDSAPASVDIDGLRDAARRSFATWAEVSGLEFVEVIAAGGLDDDGGGTDVEDVDIVVSTMGPGDHGDVCPFDATTLAHAFFPGAADPVCPSGAIHLNDTQPFTLDARPNRRRPYDLESVLLHEIGHALGLGHSSDPSAVMWSQYSGTRRALSADDRAGMLAIYGGFDDERVLSPPFWDGPLCAVDSQPVVVCFESMGLVGQRGRVTILEVDQHDVDPAGWIDLHVTPEDYIPGTGRELTCAEWEARWEPDGPGQPEFVARVVFDGVPAETMPPDAALEVLVAGNTCSP
ncbi:MAG: matrixin family metalloprotease [Myxococcales bacterium]|nr:matrixin family metalloprotease [Myxococcales bacterium]